MRKASLLVLAFFALESVAMATAQNCVAVRGIAQEHLFDSSDPIYQGVLGAVWAGPVELILGDNEVLVGKVSENDGAPRPTGHQDVGGFFIFDFGAAGTFTVQSGNSVFPNLPKFKDAAATGTFHGEGPVNTIPEIQPGTGRFAAATGNFSIKGDFMAWMVTPPLPSGRFNASITGFLCNVTP